ncbi:hypothetical protein [Haloarcula sebkhae]|uniref:Uncharacterized protein n=2 Tax=Haloarcula sebkhae TaxID=932660 RepID=A0ACC6VNF4_9EURY|nr:hypothetical protein [Haloarcula sebkhae]GGK82908.1 hypothetical protein GCM10009067_38900 [Haloarcula sebkhae]
MPKVEEDLRELNLVGVDHHGDTPYPASARKDDYEKRTAKGEINSLNKMVEQKGRIAVQYNSYRGETIVGHVSESDHVHIVIYKASERVAHKTVPPRTRLINDEFADVDITQDDILPLKAIKYDPVRVATAEDYPALYNEAPRNPACRADVLDGKVRPAIDGTGRTPSASSLTRNEVEVLAEEWLRRTDKVPFDQIANTIPRGGRNKDIENLAVTPADELIFTQVTKSDDSSTVQHKAEKLRDFALEYDLAGQAVDRSLAQKHLYMFAFKDEVAKVDSEVPDVNFFTLETLYEDCQDWETTAAMLDQMLG